MNQTKPKIKWAILYSGWGNSILKCLEQYEKGKLGNNLIVCLVSAGQESLALQRANEMEIDTIEMDPKQFTSYDEYQQFLTKELISMEIDYIFMLGYRYRIRKYMLDAFSSRIINIHPSLLPSFKNTQKAIQEAMNYGVKISGLTTHIIDERIDEGIILKQKALEIEDIDTFDSLYDKFLKTGEELICETFILIDNKHKTDAFLNEYLSK